MTRVFWALALLIFGWASAVPAQTALTTDELTVWSARVDRAEEALSNNLASDAALENLRITLTESRARFLDAQSANEASIAALREQIAALGAPPDVGPEEPDLAARRAELNDKLLTATSPVRLAQDAYSQADGLIARIDSELRERQTDRLLKLGPSPINPVLWPAAITSLFNSFSSLRSEIESNWATPTQQQFLRSSLPAILLLVALALVMLFRARHWFMWVENKIVLKTARARGIWEGLASLAQIAIPMLGVMALIRAIDLTGMLGLRGSVLLQQLVLWALVVFAARWIGLRVFRPHDTGAAFLELSPQQRAEGRFYALILGVTTAALYVLRGLTDISSFSGGDGYSDATQAVLVFPLIVIAALVLFRVGQLLRLHAKAQVKPDEELGFRDRTIGIFGRAVMVVSVVAPVLAAIGYSTAAQALIFPTILTLGLLGILTVAQRLISDAYGVATNAEDGAPDGLVPVLLGLALVALSVPIFALIWGARIADITEVWTRFKEGFVLGGSRISPSDFLTFAIVFSIGYMLTRLIQGTLRTSVLPRTKMDVGGQNAIVSGLGYFGIFLAALIAITTAGIDLSSLAIVAGALSVGIGFGLQNIVSNFVSGIILLIERPISEGDWIEVNGNTGYVRDISVRSTRIETFDRTDVIVPNADLVSGAVTNWTRGNSVGRIIVPVGVAYGTDTRKVETILKDIAEAHPMVLAVPGPSVVFQGFGADSMDFEIRAILRDVNWSLTVKSDMNHEIAKRFAEEDIEIPFAQRDVWLRNPEALKPEES